MVNKNLYKLNRIPSLADVLAKRNQNAIAERQEKRREFFWGSRVDLDRSPAGKDFDKNVDKKKYSRAEMLKKWKAEKMKKLEEEKKKQKPIFKVGVVQRKATGSPLLAQQKPYVKKSTAVQQTIKKQQRNNLEVEQTGVLTRGKAKTMGLNADKIPGVLPEEKARNKGLKVERKPVFKPQSKFYKIEAGKKKIIDSHVFKVPETVSKLSCKGLTFPNSPKVLKRKSVKPDGGKVEEKKMDLKQQDFLEEPCTPKEVNLQPLPVSPEKKGVEDMQEEKQVVEEMQEEKQVVEEMQEEKQVVEEVQGEKEVAEESKQEVNSQPQHTSPETKPVETDNYRTIVYSPFVTVRSGKKSKRKSKKSLTMDVEEKIKEEEDKFKCRIFSFRKYIEDEKKRLLDTCDKWKHIYKDFQEIPDDVEGDIDSVVGKTNLLTSDKFVQFERLIDKCENGDPFVKVDDLQGFQDWVSIEVERIDEEFHKLETRKCNNWKSEVETVNVTKVQKVKITKKCAKKPPGNSNIRSYILAARKLLKEKNANVENECQVSIPPFEAAVRTPARKESLLKDVLNSETKKKNESSAKKFALRERRNSGLEIMIATQKNKFPTPVKKSPLPTDYEIIVNEEETLKRSILKKTPLKASSATKGHVTFKRNPENTPRSRRRGLSEKYFQPLADEEMSPMRWVLGDLENLTPSRMKTRSWTRQMSQSGH